MADRKACEGARVTKVSYIAVLMLVMGVSAREGSAQQRPARFWNLTKNAISEFYLAPTGTSEWGPDQCKNDKDGRIDFDERLAISGLPSGIYDAKFTDMTGRTCTVRKIKIEPGAVFSITEKDLTSCEHR
jgi:hypothetical protein